MSGRRQAAARPAVDGERVGAVIIVAMDIVRLTGLHWEAVRRIHEEGISTGSATFETETEPDWETWNHSHLEFGRLVALIDGEVAGWAALSAISNRCVYAGVAETSIYIGARHRSRGVGSALMESLIGESERNGIWTLEARIFPENEASLRLHERFGFRTVGVRKKLGRLGPTWKDVLLLERRSERIGVE